MKHSDYKKAVALLKKQGWLHVKTLDEVSALVNSVEGARCLYKNKYTQFGKNVNTCSTQGGQVNNIQVQYKWYKKSSGYLIVLD